jgi:transposase-like protein
MPRSRRFDPGRSTSNVPTSSSMPSSTRSESSTASYQACVVALGVTATGERRVLGVDCGPSEDEAFWTRFLRDLDRRGLGGVRLVVSDSNEGLKTAIAKLLSATQWQRCRVHYMLGVSLNSH